VSSLDCCLGNAVAWMQADEQRPPPRRAKKAASRGDQLAFYDRSFRLLLPLLQKLSD